MERLFIIPDCHHPYVDRKVWDVMLRAARAFKPDHLVTLGDFGDYHCTSRHSKDPNRPRNLEFEIDANNKALDQLDALGAKHKHFIAGNHEYNVERYLMERAPELFNMVRVPELLKLKDRGWAYTPYKKFTRIGKLYLTHDTGASGADAHIRAMNDIGSNVVIGHVHAMNVTYRSTITGKHHIGLAAGWLGDVEAAEYMYKAKTKNWQHGFAVGYKLPNGTVHLVPTPIIDGACIVDGKIIR